MYQYSKMATKIHHVRQTRAHRRIQKWTADYLKHFVRRGRMTKLIQPQRSKKLVNENSLKRLRKAERSYAKGDFETSSQNPLYVGVYLRNSGSLCLKSTSTIVLVHTIGRDERKFVRKAYESIELSIDGRVEISLKMIEFTMKELWPITNCSE